MKSRKERHTGVRRVYIKLDLTSH